MLSWIRSLSSRIVICRSNCDSKGVTSSRSRNVRTYSNRLENAILFCPFVLGISGFALSSCDIPQLDNTLTRIFFIKLGVDISFVDEIYSRDVVLCGRLNEVKFPIEVGY
jgi:hypothetical protein